MIGLTILLFRGIYNTLTLEEKSHLMGHTNRNMKDNSGKGNLNWAWLKTLQTKILLCGLETLLGIFLAKNVSAFCPCLLQKNLPEVKLKSCGFILFAEEISIQPPWDCVMWILVITLM